MPPWRATGIPKKDRPGAGGVAATRGFAVDQRRTTMAFGAMESVARILKGNDAEILSQWLKSQLAAETLRPDLMDEQELRTQSRDFLTTLRQTLQNARSSDIDGAEWDDVHHFLDTMSTSR